MSVYNISQANTSVKSHNPSLSNSPSRQKKNKNAAQQPEKNDSPPPIRRDIGTRIIDRAFRYHKTHPPPTTPDYAQRIRGGDSNQLHCG